MNQHTTTLLQASLETALGSMLVIADDNALYLVDFIDDSKLEQKVKRLKKQLNATIITGRTPVIDLFEQELMLYSAGRLQLFKTPVVLLGTPFQQKVWQALQKIPFGQTCSYAQLAQVVGKTTAWRAVAQANSANRLPIIIPCHRVINTNGALGGYSSGLARKVWLLKHEKESAS
ncbi:methylated-DNA--[protein]-cysteine S-methyltransferase [Candidatus Dependentiae bacterium]|nr:methylated-DNA--[protein]-cysteine S-methyltransferase [Candidatus Dependentiae bacterium]MCC7414982.1 methylated-DNA--[protein]-cysteine S-methyltransferase [Campylobacterota bacterium]